MADPKDITSTKEEQKDETQDAYTLKDRHKTFAQIIQEQQKGTVETKPDDTAKDDTTTTVPNKEETKPTDEELAKQKQDAQDAEKKQQEAIAAKAAQDVIDKQKAEEQAKLDREKAQEDEKARQEALKPSWQRDPNARKDKDGNPLPKSYDEIAAEAARIATETATAKIREEQATREKATADESERAKAAQDAKEAAAKAYNDNISRQLKEDEDDLYAKGLMPKIKNQDDPKDPGKVAYDNLYKKAVEVNAARMKEGKPLISSLKLIFYDYYQPTLKDNKPAGHDAPVMGAESTQGDNLPDDKYIVSRDRKKSWDVVLKEEAKKQAAKFRVRN